MVHQKEDDRGLLLALRENKRTSGRRPGRRAPPVGDCRILKIAWRADSAGPPGIEGGPIAASMTMNPPPGVPRWGEKYRDFLAKYYTRHMAMTTQTENLPYADQMIDLDPNVRDKFGLPAPRMTYDWRRPNEVARVEFVHRKLEELGRAMGATQVWRAPPSPGSPISHHQGGTRMGSDPTSRW